VLIYRPPKGWSAIYHPLYGFCLILEIKDLEVKDDLVKSGVEFIKLEINFDAAFPTKPISRHSVITKMQKNKISNFEKSKTNFCFTFVTRPESWCLLDM
jgi:hypothetical protein